MPHLKLRIFDSSTSDLTPARIHIQDANGEFVYPEGCIPYDRDCHFTVDGQCEAEVSPGKISILVEKGKEFLSVSRELTVGDGDELKLEFKMERWINMAELGWISGDLHIHRPLDDMPQLVMAEDLNVAPVITAWNQKNDWAEEEIPAEKVVAVDGTHSYGILTQEDERGGGAVMVMNLDEPIDLGKTSRWYPPSLTCCRAAKEKGYVVDQEKPFWWEAPVNVALGGVDTIGIINNHMQRATIMNAEAWGRARNIERYPGFEGFVENVLDLYYHYLNLGLKFPISAGSASGVLRCPVGYNRLYVHMDEGFDYDAWFEGMKAGRAFATNGPMLFFSIDGCDLGATLSASEADGFKGTVKLECLSQTKLDRIEVLENGEVIYEFDPSGSSEFSEEFEVSCNSSCWIGARAFEKNEETVRFAHTNPIYIEIGGPMRPRRESAQFYADWCEELLAESAADEERYGSEKERREVETLYQEAIDFYRGLMNDE